MTVDNARNADAAAAPVIWALVDDRAGNRSQVVGVAEAVGHTYELKELGYGPLARLPNALLGPTFMGLSGPSKKRLTPPWPDLIIAAGRRTAPVARRIKQLSQGSCRLLQIMWPGSGGFADFDTIAVPDHDPRREGANVMMITGAPHRFTAPVLESLRKAWQERFQLLPKPWVSLLIGGSTKNRRFTERMAADLVRQALDATAATGGSLLVSTSRRTSVDITPLFDDVTVPVRICDWRQPEENPYGGYIACADYTIVTGDSMSMCTEACATQSPVYVFAPHALTTEKHKRFHDQLFAGGYAKPFDGRLDNWRHPPLNPAVKLAERAEQLLER